MKLKRSIFLATVFLLCFDIMSFSIAQGSDIDLNPLFKIAGMTKQGYSLGYIDKTGKVIIPLKFREANDFSEELAVVMTHDNTKYGYIDKTGRMAIKQQFNNGAMAFSEGLAAVGINGKWGYIDKSGKFAIALQYQSAQSFHDGLAVVNIDGKYKYIDKTGKVAIETNGSADFSDGMANVGSTYKCGYIDVTGKINISLKYSECQQFSEGLASVTINTPKISAKGFIDKKGNVVIEPKFSSTVPFSEGLSLVKYYENLQTKEGYVDKTGNTVIKLPPVSQAVSFSEGLAPILIKDKGWGYIDKTGGFVIQPQYVHAERFKNGLARVSTGNLKDSAMDRDAYIDKTGKEVWSTMF